MKAMRHPCEDEYSSRIAATHATCDGREHAGRCLYCNQPVVGGVVLHEYCKGDYEWELKMKAMNNRWRPS